MTDTLTALRRDLDALDRRAGFELTSTDDITSELLLQVVMIEEALAAPWWRRRAALRRWRADIAASIRDVGGQGFIQRRMETIGTGWLSRERMLELARGGPAASGRSGTW